MSIDLKESAKEVGRYLRTVPEIGQAQELDSPVGHLQRINGLVDGSLPLAYQHKKHVFSGELDKTPIVILFYSDPVYGQDPNYFTRWYEESKKIFSGQITRTADTKLFPELYSAHDMTRTLVLENGGEDLTKARSVDPDTVLGTFKQVTGLQRKNVYNYPRYVGAFLEPEYAYLKTQNIEDYYSDPALLELYHDTQDKVKKYLFDTNRAEYLRGFGVPDCTAANLLQSPTGEILLVDVERSDFAYHWLSLAGHLYQTLGVREPADTNFTGSFREKILEATQDDPDLPRDYASGLLVVGRLNSLLIPCTIRNVVFASEIGRPIGPDLLVEQLDKVNMLMRVDSLESALE